MSTPTAAPITAVDILSAMRTALSKFGTYAFDDKGPCEVMDIGGIVRRLRERSATEAAQIIQAVHDSRACKQRGRQVAVVLTYSMDDWDALFEQPKIEEYYNE